MWARDADVLVFLERDFGLDRDRRRKSHRLAALELLPLHAGYVDRVEGGFVERRVVGGWQDQVKGLLAQCRPADLSLHHRARCLTGPEARNPNARRQPSVGLVHRPRDLLHVDFDRQDDLRARFSLSIDLDRGHGFYATSSPQIRKRPSGQGRCGRRDSNPHGLRHTVLSRAPVPIRLRPQGRHEYSDVTWLPLPPSALPPRFSMPLPPAPQRSPSNPPCSTAGFPSPP